MTEAWPFQTRNVGLEIFLIYLLKRVRRKLILSLSPSLPKVLFTRRKLSRVLTMQSRCKWSGMWRIRLFFNCCKRRCLKQNNAVPLPNKSWNIHSAKLVEIFEQRSDTLSKIKNLVIGFNARKEMMFLHRIRSEV